jgi:hypothetical protein
MYDELDLGTTPTAEDCVQLGEPDYYNKSRAECRRFSKFLTKVFGEPPTTAFFKIKSCPHDFGTYHEVVVKYDDKDPVAAAYAFACENQCPERWTDDKPIDWRKKDA